MASCESIWPRRQRSLARRVRWPNNLAITALNAIVVRAILPLTVAGIAMRTEAKHWGVSGAMALPRVPTIILAVVLLDLLIYLQHLIFHAVPMLWRVHRMHHADLDLDVTSGARFHPIEIVLSTAIKFGAVVALGTPAVAVLLFEVLLNATSMFNHSNLALPLKIDRLLRWCLVTPDMHRVHHSIIMRETNSNFGFNLPWWDRLFGTYRAQPAAGHLAMTIGIEQFRDPCELRLDRVLVQPWRCPAGSYPIARQSTR